ncbi:ZIP Zinc transporter family protein [Trichomonas vaginalis G3]|uniref:ZIP Zinc transporter family protein n=1 Tax=Trichomonas vaginalis (strain ATCC PRA-98 / G3) TaxID=412133 RepID=A2EQX5_TRIV3|nr:zinc ion transmembrane transporter protein [Trichomonas vaginalis G3]EAY04949.1 ZIP Zinc transporter family protein [Trichomonas vaginalis G3]KAI5508765.1 zinc ion transmembrane transporter protein [Trichomonas vaginalis G3]|eukprot:XP_001317172.1 ZIP Zinc transporter family protein [Trichomonas vaginalis G3]
MDKKTLLKWISAFVIWFTTLIGSSLPLCIKSIRWQSRLEALAGGVFLGAGLAHLLADSFEEFDKMEKKIDYPLAPAICIGTFVIFTSIELFSYGEHDEEFQIGDEHDHHGHNKHEKLENKSELNSNLLESNESEYVTSYFSSQCNALSVPASALYIIMDIHSAIEGLALGIMKELGSIIAIFCAIVGHKPVEAFALSLIILKDKPNKILFWVMVIVYTLMSPIGLIVGIFIANMKSGLTTGIIAAFSAGTFLFVGCHEWAEMFEHKATWACGEKFWHFMMFFIGVLWMLLIAIVETFAD